MMKVNVIKSIENTGNWENIFKQKQSTFETIIFKTSNRCMISFMAKKQFQKWVKKLPEDCNINIYEIDVNYQRAVSNCIAEDTNVLHQSPQVIWLNKDKTVKYHFSHGEINGYSLQNYFEK